MRKLVFCTLAIVVLMSAYASAAPQNRALEFKSDPNKDFSANGVDGKLVGKIQLVEIDLPNTQQSVEARGKLTTAWGRLKAQ